MNTNREMAESIVDALMAAGSGERALRLALKGRHGADLGGWCREAAIEQAEMAMKPSIVIYGPQGCGKTHNARALAAIHGFDKVHDSEADNPPKFGHLILSQEPLPGFENIPFAGEKPCG